jgi:hypothetical protein
MRRILLLLAVAALVLASCRGESITRVRISPDGTAILISEFAFDEEALGFIGELDDTPTEVLQALAQYIDPSALPVAAADVEPEHFARGDLQGIRVTIEGLDPVEVAAQLSDGNSIIEDIDLSLDGTTLRLAGRTRPVSDFERARLLSLVSGDLSEILGLVLQIADRVLEGGLLEWDLLSAILDGEDVFVTVEAQVEPGFQFVGLDGTPFPPPEPQPEAGGTSWWVAVVPFVLAGAVSWFVISRLRRRRLPEIEGFTPRG